MVTLLSLHAANLDAVHSVFRYVFKNQESKPLKMKYSALKMSTINPKPIAFFVEEKTNKKSCRTSSLLKTMHYGQWSSQITVPGFETSPYSLAEKFLIKYTTAV